MHTTRARGLLLFFCGCASVACEGQQSALEPAGKDAAAAAELFTWMAFGAVAIWTGVVALAVIASRARAATPSVHRALIVGGGVVFPILVLTTLLTFALSELRAMLEPASTDRLAIQVTGAQWWWRVRYHMAGREPIESANEIRLPLGRRVDVRLESRDVIHSFWVPSLAGKIDMIPGRTNRLSLEPTATGTFRGACAEFCGEAHARMNFLVVVAVPGEFDAWIAAEAQPALAPAGEAAVRGEQLFMERGCATCHTVRGTTAAGRVGPDLTHVGRRLTLAAGTLPFGAAEVQRWITGTRRIKPGVHMPPFDGLAAADLDALAAYLTGLQ